MEIVQYPHPTLRHKSKPLRKVNKDLKDLVAQMFPLMYEARGVGLAANQVDLPFQLFIVNESAEPNKGEELVFINPVIDKPKGREEKEEGCLSLPGIHANVSRPTQIHVTAYDLNGSLIDATFDGLLARIIQHEYDHIHGTMFIDRIAESTYKQIDGELDEFEIEFDGHRASGKIPSDQDIAARLKKLEDEFC